MPEVPLEKIPALHATTEELAAIWDTSVEAAKKRMERAGYSRVQDPSDGRRWLIPLSALRDEDRRALAAQRASRSPHQAEGVGHQGNLFFSPELRDQSGETVSAIPKEARDRGLAIQAALAECVDGNFGLHIGETIAGVLIRDRYDYRRAMAARVGEKPRKFKSLLALLNKINRDPRIPWAEKDRAFLSHPQFLRHLVPKKRPGLRGHSIYDGHDEGTRWLREQTKALALNQARLSVPEIRSKLILEINAKKAVWGNKKHYPVPSERQIRTFLKRVPRVQDILARQGEKAYNDKCAPYISRDPESLRSNDVWVTDQKQIDVRLRGAGEQLGRIWMVSFLDARSFKVMGYWFGPVLSSDMVISAAAVGIGRHGVPRAVLMDLGKEFQCTAFHGSFRKIKGETLFKGAQGLCQRLRIDVIDAIGRNPQTKPIERWHRECARFDHHIPGWCGSSTDERPEVLAQFERQHEDWKKTGRGCSPLFTIEQYLIEFCNWIENEWNAQHRGRGKYLRGMTPNECWNTHQPEGGVRRVSQSTLDLATADHRFLKIARGGQINVTLHGKTLEYTAPELFLRQGQELEVIISRRSLRKITVLDSASNGRFLCEATAKPLFHWGLKTPEDREELRQSIRANRAMRKAVYQGNAARRVLEVTATPVQIGPQERPIREISSVEFQARRRDLMGAPRMETAEESVRRMLELQGG